MEDEGRKSIDSPEQFESDRSSENQLTTSRIVQKQRIPTKVKVKSLTEVIHA
jgi:hypothetical protein